MKETKPYWYHNTAYSRAPYFICCHFPNLFRIVSNSSDYKISNKILVGSDKAYNITGKVMSTICMLGQNSYQTT